MANLRVGRGSVAVGYGRVGNYVKVHPLGLFSRNDLDRGPSAKKQARSRKELSGRFAGFGDRASLADNGKTPIYLEQSCGVVVDNLSTEAILAYLTSRNRQGILGLLVSGVRPTSSDVHRTFGITSHGKNRNVAKDVHSHIHRCGWICGQLCRWEDLRWHKLNMHLTLGAGLRICSGTECRIRTGRLGSPG